MKLPRRQIEVFYRVLDASGGCVEVIKQKGFNRNYIKWLVERKVTKKYGKGMKIHPFKIREEN